MASTERIAWHQRDTAPGFVLIAATILSFILLNGPTGEAFHHLLEDQITGLSVGLGAGVAFAQAPAAPAAPAAAPAAGAKAPAAAVVKAPAKTTGVPKQATTPEGIECSKQADAQNLHGKPRKAFRKKCVADIKKAAKAAAGGAAPSAAKAPAAPTPAAGAPAAGGPAKKN